jgi:hypothetical protein
MVLERLLLVGIILSLILVIPVSAELKFQENDDGSELISNGSYWIKWDHVSDHVIGDKFFINTSTNFPVGTKLLVEYENSNYFGLNVPGTGGESTIAFGDNISRNNQSSNLLDTTGLREGQYYLLFEILKSPDPLISIYFDHLGVYSDLNLISVGKNNVNVSKSKTTLSNISLITPTISTITSVVSEKNMNLSSGSLTQKAPMSLPTLIAALTINLCLFLTHKRKNNQYPVKFR